MKNRHRSLIEDIKFNLDGVKQDHKAGQALLTGWCASNKKFADIKGLRIKIGDSVLPTEYGFPREDVEKAYGCKDYLESGFGASIELSVIENHSLLSFQALLGGSWVKVMDFKDLFSPTRPPLEMVEKVMNPKENFFNKLDFKTSDKTDFGSVFVDNFYEEPDKVREFALSLDYEGGNAGQKGESKWYKGFRTKKRYQPEGLKEKFEQLINKKITNWEHYMNGVFSWCTAETPIVYHSDSQTYAGAVYLTPDAPPGSGTSFWRSRTSPLIRKSNGAGKEIFPNGYFDKHQFELVDQVGNVYNRLAIWDAKLIHSATSYFGNTKENSRLFHLFFFDAE